MPEYLYDGRSYKEEDIFNAARSQNLSMQDYIQKHGIETANGFVDDSEEDINVKNDLFSIGKQYLEAISTGWETGRTTEENLEVFKGSKSLEDIQAMIKAGFKRKLLIMEVVSFLRYGR